MREEYLQPPVSSLQQVAKLQILEVGLKSQVVFRRVSHHRSAHPLCQPEARIAAPTAGLVIWCARRAGGTFPDRAGWRQLTGAVLVLAGAAVELLGEFAELVVLRAIQKGLEMAQPVGLRAVSGNEGKKKRKSKSKCLLASGQLQGRADS